MYNTSPTIVSLVNVYYIFASGSECSGTVVKRLCVLQLSNKANEKSNHGNTTKCYQMETCIQISKMLQSKPQRMEVTVPALKFNIHTTNTGFRSSWTKFGLFCAI